MKDIKDPYFFRAITNDIEILVQSQYLKEIVNSEDRLFVWNYQVFIKNHGDLPVELLHRYWRIIDDEGHVQEVAGEGVVGKKPIIVPNSQFEYISSSHLLTPCGTMDGYYQMSYADGSTFSVKIPSFTLDSPFVGNKIIH